MSTEGRPLLRLVCRVRPVQRGTDDGAHVSVELILADHPIRAVEALATDLKVHRPEDPFTPQVVWLTDPSLEGWMKTWLAHHAGIAANLELAPLRSGVLAAWVDENGTPLAEPSAAELAAEVLGVWRSAADEQLSELADMLDQGLPEDRAAREVALAMQVGDWLSARFWDGCVSDPSSPKPVGLQPWLAATLAAVDDARAVTLKTAPTALPATRVYVLASRSLSAREWSLLERMGDHDGVQFAVFHAVSDPDAWSAGSGFPTGSMAARMLGAESDAARPSNRVSVRIHRNSTWVDRRTATPALSHIHAALRQPHAPVNPASPLASAGSIFLPAWSPRREVEQLRDRLLQRFSKDLTFNEGTRLEPRDVLVLTADMATYGPLIATIFGARPTLADDGDAKAGDAKSGDAKAGGANSGEAKMGAKGPGRCPAIPTALAGLGLSQINPVAGALLTVLTIAADRLTAPLVAQLATTPVVQAAFSIPADAAAELDELLRETHAAWGFDAADKQAVYGPPRAGISLHPNSMAFAAQRLALSAFMHDESQSGTAMVRLPEGALRPLSLASRDRTQLAGAVDRLVGTLRSTCDDLRQNFDATAAGWNAELKAIVRRFSRTGATTAFLTDMVETAIDETISARDDVRLTLEGVRRLLRSRFDLPVSAKGDYGSVVRVQALRAGPVPYRPLVVFLGMSSGAWPRRPRRPEWWLPSLGPSPLALQRKAFADALLSAGHSVWLSYCARELSKGQEQPPSALVQELEDLFGPDEATRKTWRSPLGRQAWSRQAAPSFDRAVQDARVVVERRDAPATGTLANAGDTAPADTAPVLPALGGPDDGSVQHLKTFSLVSNLLNPSQTFLYRRMGVYLSEAKEAVSEREPLESDGLSKYQIRTQAFEWLQDQGADLKNPADLKRCVEALVAAQQGTGALSLGSTPELDTEDCVREAADILATLQSLKGRLVRNVAYSVELLHAGTRLKLSTSVPWVRELPAETGTGTRLLHVWPHMGSSLHRPRLQAWLGFWIARALGKPLDGAYIVSKKEIEWLIPIQGDSADSPLQPKAVLAELLTLYDAALRRPMHLFKNSSMELVNKLCAPKRPSDEEKLRAAVKRAVADKWFDSKYNWDPDECDRWIAALHPGLRPDSAAERSANLLTALDDLPAPLADAADVVSTSRQLWERLLWSRKPAKGHKKLLVDGCRLSHWTAQ